MPSELDALDKLLGEVEAAVSENNTEKLLERIETLSRWLDTQAPSRVHGPQIAHLKALLSHTEQLLTTTKMRRDEIFGLLNNLSSTEKTTSPPDPA